MDYLFILYNVDKIKIIVKKALADTLLSSPQQSFSKASRKSNTAYKLCLFCKLAIFYNLLLLLIIIIIIIKAPNPVVDHAKV
jgi:hypothetical protein